MLQVAFFTIFALLLARVMRAPRGTWRWILGAAAAVLAASQLLPAGNAFRENVRGSIDEAFWLAAVAVPVVGYALLVRQIRRRTGVARPASVPRRIGLVLVADDAALARDTVRLLAAEEGAEMLSVGWRDPEGAMAGHARLRLGGELADLELLWVAPGERGRGIGGRLLAQAETEARERGAARLAATAGEAGAGFLARRGFAVYGRLEGAGRSHLVKVLA
jgi:GNAT superfamily N-acetyltransferase